MEACGDFPKTHNLKELLELVSRISPIKRIVRKNAILIDILEDAYIASRYLGAEYGREEYRRCKEFVKKMWKVIWNESV